jgi:homoserine O-acetyltransferase
MAEQTMYVEKQVFEMPTYTTVGGKEVRQVRVGFETYGTLSAGRDNVVLVPHFFTANSHAAGKYRETDAAPGYWDGLIGPGKAIDTNRFFVISVDSLCNVNTDPYTVTTGPSSIDPDTGKPYGLRFPVITVRDSVNVQHALLSSLGISRLHAVVGVSMGSMQAMVWAANFPDQVERVIGLTPNGVAAGDYGIQAKSQWMQAIRLDPKWRGGDYYSHEAPLDGISLALSGVLLTARHWDWATATYARRAADEQKSPYEHLDHRFAVEAAFEAYSRARAPLVDANNFLYLTKANQMYSLMPGSPDGDYRHIRAKTLLVTVDTDLLLPPQPAKQFGDMLLLNGTSVRMKELATSGGHLAGIVEVESFAQWVAEFLDE